MEQPRQTTRKKILLWGATVLAALPFFKFFPPQKIKKESPNETVKMFSQEGKLVEIDKRLFVSTGSKISNEELKKWIKK